MFSCKHISIIFNGLVDFAMCVSSILKSFAMEHSHQKLGKASSKLGKICHHGIMKEQATHRKTTFKTLQVHSTCPRVHFWAWSYKTKASFQLYYFVAQGEYHFWPRLKGPLAPIVFCPPSSRSLPPDPSFLETSNRHQPHILSKRNLQTEKMPPPAKQRKIAIVGSRSVGKSCLCLLPLYLWMPRLGSAAARP